MEVVSINKTEMKSYQRIRGKKENTVTEINKQKEIQLIKTCYRELKLNKQRNTHLSPHDTSTTPNKNH